MSSLPSWASMAWSLSNQPRITVGTAPVTRNTTGNTTTMITATMMAPSTMPIEAGRDRAAQPSRRHGRADSGTDPRPRLDLDRRAKRKGGHADGRSGRPVIAEGGHVGPVHDAEVVHVGEKHRRFHDV